MELEIWTSDGRGRYSNTTYPHAWVAHSPEELKDLVKTDHTFIHFRNNTRSKENFLYSDVLVLDVDNKGESDPTRWVTPDTLRDWFPGVGFITYTSRNHMKQKENESPRPRFHVIFSIDRITDHEEYKALTTEMQESYPCFDKNALDAGRFFYGTLGTEVSSQEGGTLNDFLYSFAQMGSIIPEGGRNRTLFDWLTKSMTRYGTGEETRQKFLERAKDCVPPLPDIELDTIWRSAETYYKKKTSKEAGYIPPEEYGKPQWEEPIPFEKADLESFPLSSLPEDIATFVAEVAESTQTPVDMAGTIALATLSVCIQGKYVVQGKPDWTEPLNTYSLYIAPPSERKSAVENLMLKPVNDYEEQYNTQNAAAVEAGRMKKRVLESRQRTIEKAVATGKAEPDELDLIAKQIAEFEEPRPLQLYVDDITTEKLVSVLAANKGRAALISSEGGIFDTLAGTYTKNVNIDVMLKAYSGDTIRVDRIGRDSESVWHPALTVMLMTQPNVVTDVLNNKVFRGRGLTARFLYCMPVSHVGNRSYRTRSVTQTAYIKYERLLNNMLEEPYTKKPEVITLSREADDLLASFAEELEPKILKEYAEIADWVGKLVGNTLRIAGLLCRAETMRGSDFLGEPAPLVVSGGVMEKAIALGRYFLNHAGAVFSVLPENGIVEQAEKVLKMIREKRMTKFNRREAMRNCRSFRTVGEIQPVLDFLEDYGYIASAPSKGGKSALPSYQVNPQMSQLSRSCHADS